MNMITPWIKAYLMHFQNSDIYFNLLFHSILKREISLDQWLTSLLLVFHFVLKQSKELGTSLAGCWMHNAPLQTLVRKKNSDLQ